MSQLDRKVDAWDFIAFVLLSLVTLGIWDIWWVYSRIESSYRYHSRSLKD